jgi:hypothetical protein
MHKNTENIIRRTCDSSDESLLWSARARLVGATRVTRRTMTFLRKGGATSIAREFFKHPLPHRLPPTFHVPQHAGMCGYDGAHISPVRTSELRVAILLPPYCTALVT